MAKLTNIALLSLVWATQVFTTELNDKESVYIWKPKTGDSVVVEVAEGYKILVSVEECNIDGENEEYATLSTNNQDISTDGLMFSYIVTGRPSYLYNKNKLYASFSGTSASYITLNFTRVGEALTTITTTEPSTTIILPTPSINDSTTITVYLEGKYYYDYQKPATQRLLQDAILNMAIEYCDTQNFNLVYPLSRGNVEIILVEQCPDLWPDYELCARVTFAVPVLLNETEDSPWEGYQLKTKHLEIMWERYSIKYLTQGITEYSKPEINTILKLQLIIICAIILLFIITLFIIRNYSAHIGNFVSKRKLSDTASIMTSGNENIMDLHPHPLQDIPPLFENVYPMYNPEKRPEYTKPTYIKPYTDNPEDIEIFRKDTILSQNGNEESGA